MLRFNDALRIATEHFGEPFAPHGWEDDGAFLVTPQRVVEDEQRGLVEIGAPWIAVDRSTGEIETWPTVLLLDRVRTMRRTFR